MICPSYPLVNLYQYQEVGTLKKSRIKTQLTSLVPNIIPTGSSRNSQLAFWRMRRCSVSRPSSHLGLGHEVPRVLMLHTRLESIFMFLVIYIVYHYIYTYHYISYIQVDWNWMQLGHTWPKHFQNTGRICPAALLRRTWTLQSFHIMFILASEDLPASFRKIVGLAWSCRVL